VYTLQEYLYVCTCVFDILVVLNCFLLQLVGEKQQELQVNSMQLLYYQAPLSAAILVFVIPFFEDLDAFHGVLYNWPFETLVRVAVSFTLLCCDRLR
jgi:solute carrier family 35 protein E3